MSETGSTLKLVFVCVIVAMLWSLTTGEWLNWIAVVGAIVMAVLVEKATRR